jgi:hypothetical protein
MSEVPSLLLNLLLGRLGENYFERLIKTKLPGVELRSHTAASHLIEQEERKYGITNYDVLLQGKNLFHANIKVHATQFREAQRMVGLDPDNCFPLAVYKILSGSGEQRRTNIPFLFLVFICWDLRKTIAQYTSALEEPLQQRVGKAFGKGKRDRAKQDALVNEIVSLWQGNDTWSMLLRELEKSEHRVISPEKALHLLIENIEERCPALVIPRFRFAGEINMHLAIREEMTDLEDFFKAITDCQSSEDVLKKITDINI